MTPLQMVNHSTGEVLDRKMSTSSVHAKGTFKVRLCDLVAHRLGLRVLRVGEVDHIVHEF